MTKDMVIKTREKLKAQNVQMEICVDNNFYFIDSDPDSLVIWRDSEEYMLCIRRSVEREQATRPLEFFYAPYEYIQYIRANVSYKDALAIAAKEIKASDLPTATQMMHDMCQGLSYTGSTGDGIKYPGVIPPVK